MQIKHLTLIPVISFCLAWVFDQIFWQQVPGISFIIFVVLCLTAGWFLTRQEQLKPAKTSLVLIAPILSFSLIIFLRLEPFTQFISYVLALASMVVLSLTWLGGRWWAYSFGDYLSNTIRWFGQVLYQPLKFFQIKRDEIRDSKHTGNDESSIALIGKRNRNNKNSPALSVAFGLLLALPVIGFLGTLLASADPIFSKHLENILSVVNLESLPEYIFRTAYILFGAYLLGGVFLYSLLYSREEKVSAGSKTIVHPFLGWITAATMLASINLLFAFFVAVQFKYFFGGRTNIALEGFTFAEYARRGFGELVAVALFSLLILVGLNMITRRNPGWSRRTYSMLSITLVGFVCVILVSAFQRLLLYETAYGYTRSRTYTHVFMLWLGILLIIVVGLEVTRKHCYLSLAFIFVALGFGVSIVSLNIDGFIVRQNTARAAKGKPLDTGYLVKLSEDAVPELIQQFEDTTHSNDLHNQIGGVLACRIAIAKAYAQPRTWASLNLSYEKARRLYKAYEEKLIMYSASSSQGIWQVFINGNEVNCHSAVNYLD